MNWTEISVLTNEPGIEVITGALLNIGITGVRIENSNDFNEFLEGTQTYWDYVDEDLMYLKDCETRVIFYIPENSQGMDMLSAFKQEIDLLKDKGFGSLSLSFNNVKEEDWENNWKKYFKPFEIGNNFIIKPTWESVVNKDNKKILQIDPGMSFGTGTHETTALCLEAMEAFDLTNKAVLDLGCGSGILSIGALLLGAKKTTLVDIDKNSIRIAGENIEQNDFSKDKYELFVGNITENTQLRDEIGYEKYDFIFANIVADVLKAMSPYFNSFLRSDSKLIVSGIITERKDEVINTIKENGFKVVKEFQRGAWACVILEN